MKADSSTVDKGSGGGRPRDPLIDAAIFGATTELLVEVGYSNLSMAAVAERAGTSKGALYRRWSSKAELVHEVAFPSTIALPETADHNFAADIRVLICATRDMFVTPAVRAALPGLMADVVDDPELNARVMSKFVGVFEAVGARVSLGIEHGEVHSDVDPARLVELIGGSTMMRLLLTPAAPLDDLWVDQTAAVLTHGVVRSSHRNPLPGG